MDNEMKHNREKIKKPLLFTGEKRWNRNARMISNTGPPSPIATDDPLDASRSLPVPHVETSKRTPTTPPPAPAIVMTSKDPDSLFNGGGIRLVRLFCFNITGIGFLYFYCVTRFYQNSSLEIFFQMNSRVPNIKIRKWKSISHSINV